MKKTLDNEWNKLESRFIRKCYSPTFVNSADFDHKHGIKCLSKVLHNYITDRTFNIDFILRFLSTYNYEQRSKLVCGVEYKCDFKIVPMILEQPESPERLCALAMSIEPMELYVRDFHDLLRLKRTDEENFDVSRKLLEILLAFNNSDMKTFTKTYENLFKISIEKDLDIFKDKESTVSKLLVKLLEGKRDEVPGHSAEIAKLIAEQLHQVDEGTSNIDRDSFIQLFTQDSFTQLSAIFDRYEDKYGQSMEALIEREFEDKNDIRCFQDIIDYTRLPSAYYSKKIRQALDEIPIDYRTLIRIIIGHENKDLCEIKLEYSKIYDEKLDETIENRVDIPEVKYVFVMILTERKKAVSSSRQHVDIDHTDKNNRNHLRVTPIATSDMPIQKSRSQEAFDKLAHLLKIKSLQ